MGVFIFFSLSAVIIILGLGITVLTLRHHWKLSRAANLGAQVVKSPSEQ